MSDYTVKREKEDILRIQAEGTKMPGPLTINERDYADDKRLIVGGSGSSSPVGLAKVIFVTNMTFEQCFLDFPGLPAYYPAGEDYTETTSVYDPVGNIDDWNSSVDDGHTFLITPCALYKNGENLTYTIEGDAEFRNDDYGEYILVTGDCTITITLNDQGGTQTAL